jgi:hypothetical protein
MNRGKSVLVPRETWLRVPRPEIDELRAVYIGSERTPARGQIGRAVAECVQNWLEPGCNITRNPVVATTHYMRQRLTPEPDGGGAASGVA